MKTQGLLKVTVKCFELEEEKYVESGKINKEIELELEETKINEKTKYFKIKNLTHN